MSSASPTRPRTDLSTTVVDELHRRSQHRTIMRTAVEEAGVLHQPVPTSARRLRAMRLAIEQTLDVFVHGQTTTLARFASPGASLFAGSRVLAGHGEGNVYDAVVLSTTDEPIVLALDMGTCRQTDHSPTPAV